MDPVERFLTASANRPCRACRYARATAHDGLYCDRCTGSPYPCEVERASAPLEAWLYRACGRHGRFFEPKPTAPEWSVADASGPRDPRAVALIVPPSSHPGSVHQFQRSAVTFREALAVSVEPPK